MKAISYQSKTGETQIVINNNLESIDHLFYSSSNQCCKPNHIKSIAIKSSNPITTSLKYLFSGTQFESIDLTNFDLSKVTSFNGMFNGNDKLVSVKFGDSITSSANTMEGMFYNCKNLVSLDLSNFDTSKVTSMKELFRDCNKLTYLNIKNLKVSNVENFSAMFCLCNSLTSLDLSNFITTKAKDMGQMFEHCDSLQYINISNFDTSKVINMNYMFNSCPITSLDLSNFDITSVTGMVNIFYECKSLISLNLNHFNGLNVEDMNHMFYGCLNLKYLDIENFKTYKVVNMNGMFDSCIKLNSLSLKNFNTSLTTDMGYMFANCDSLNFLDINNFNTKNVIIMNNMFKNCKSLTSLNLSNFHISENTDYLNMFSGIAENIIYCANDDLYGKIKEEMDKKECAIRDNNCIIESTWTNNISKKIIYETGKCVDKCNMTKNYKYEYENKCYSFCPKGTTSLFNRNNICEIFDEQIFINNEKKQQKTEQIITTEYIEITGNTEENKDNNKNTEENEDNNNNPEENKDGNNIEENSNNITIKTDNIIINRVSSFYKFCQPEDFLKNKCSPSKYLSMIALIKNAISNGTLNDILGDVINDNKIDIYQKDEDNIKYLITSSFNQKNKKYENISIINLDEQCESELKKSYNINNNQTLIIFKYDYKKMIY